MKIVVCVKHVPDVQADRAFGPDGRVARSDDDVLNELDENAVEAALQLVEEHGGEVVALTVGPPPASGAVRRALQLGVAAAVQVTDERLAGADVLATAQTLAAAIRYLGADEPVDLVVTGMASLDALTSLLPSALAAHLGIPALTLAADVTVEGRTVRVRRDVGDAREIREAELPLLLSVTDQANEPRYPNFKGIMAAKKKPITQLTLADLGLGTDGELPASRTAVVSAGARPARPAGQVVIDSGDGGLRLAAFLAERKVL